MIRELFLSDSLLWSCVWQSTIFLVVGLVSSFILRHRSARAHQVLFLAMIAAVIVPIMSILVKRYELGMFVAEPVVIQSPAKDLATASNYGVSGDILTENIEHNLNPIERDLPSAMAGSESAKFPWRSVVLYGWIAASLILAARLLLTFALGVRLLGRALPLDCQRIEEALNLARAKLGIDKDVMVRSSRGVRSPVIWCWRRRPVLLVPSAAGRFDNGVDWAGVLCHELAHWKRRDHISGLLAELVVCILPWHPLVWWAKSRLLRLSEQACDDWVVASGQPCTDYAESLLDLTPQGQMAFVPAVVRSRKGLAGRVGRILKDSCGNPRTGIAWVLVMCIVATCLAFGVAFAQTRPGGLQEKFVHFPKDRSLGKLYISDPEKSREFEYWFHWTSVGQPSEYLCEARGDVHVPAGKRLSLTISPTALRDLSPLAKLRPDDLHGIAFEYTPRYQTRATDECMTHIARLTGLKSLVLTRTNVTDRGIRYIRNLKSLEHLDLPVRVTDRGMAYVAELTSLKRLYFSIIDGSSQVTNAGLRYLAKLTNLEELALMGERMGDAGLAYIKDLPRLEYLFIRGSHFGDNGMVHVKNISSLRMLSFHEGIAHITDAGLVHISDLPKLESLCLHGMRDITDNGLAHLSKMRSLRKLEIGSSQVTDKGLGYLSQIKTLERLDLPQEQKGITDKGLTYLGQLPNLKHLSISRIHYVDPSMNKEYYTDKGLAKLAKCRLLEELNIGSIGITDAGMEHIAKLTNLKRLSLFGCDNVTDSGLAKLTALKSLRNLSITDADISIKELNNFKPMPNLTKLKIYDLQRKGAILDLSGLTTLEDLSLNFRPRSQDEFVDADLMGLANLKKLKWLQIGPRNYTDKGLMYLAQLPNIERLGIGGSGLTDEGLKYLTNMKKLNHLSIIGRFDANKRDFTSGGNITDKGLRHLGKLKMLSFLNIYSENTFSTAALQHLQKELPNLFYLMINGRNALGRSNLMGMGQQAPSLRQSTNPTPVKQTRDRPSRFDIQIETRILLVSEDFLQSIGFDANSIHDANAWSKLTPGVLAASDDPNILGLILDDLNVSFLLKATQAHEGTKMLAAPPVTVFDGEEATVSIHKQVNYISGYSEPNRPSDKPEPKHDSLIKGIELQLTPKLTPDNKNIILDVDFELSEVIGFEKRMYKEKYPYKIPQIDVVSRKTHCLFPNGKTLLIGGQNIITEEDGRKMKKKLLVLMKAEKVDSESFGAPKLGGYGGYGGYGYGPPPGPGKSEYRYNPNRPAEPNQM